MTHARRTRGGRQARSAGIFPEMEKNDESKKRGRRRGEQERGGGGAAPTGTTWRANGVIMIYKEGILVIC